MGQGFVGDFIQQVTSGRHQSTAKIAQFKAGDTVRVHVKVREGEKERIQVFRGVVLKVRGHGMGKSFTVRKVSGGIGVERTFPFASPSIDKVEVVAKGKVKRSRLFYLRKRKGRAATVSSERVRAGEELRGAATDDSHAKASNS